MLSSAKYAIIEIDAIAAIANDMINFLLATKTVPHYLLAATYMAVCAGVVFGCKHVRQTPDEKLMRIRYGSIAVD